MGLIADAYSLDDIAYSLMYNCGDKGNMALRTILVVEDDPNDENLTLRALRNCGVPCSVVVAHTAQEAMDFLLRQAAFSGRTSPDPHVVFLDNTLPGSDGFELVTNIRSVAAFRGIPLVILSGSSDQNVIERCARAGANSFLEKPMEMPDYMREVGNAAKYWLDLNLSPVSLRRSHPSVAG